MILSVTVLDYLNKPVEYDTSQADFAQHCYKKSTQLCCDEYAKLEKELLAIVYACEKFDQDIFDRSNVIVEQP